MAQQQQQSANPFMNVVKYGVAALPFIGLFDKGYTNPALMSPGQAQSINQGLIQGMNYDVGQALTRIQRSAAPALNLIGANAAAQAQTRLANTIGTTLSQGGGWGGSRQMQLQLAAAPVLQQAYANAVQQYLANLLAQEAGTRASYAATAANLLGSQVPQQTRASPLTDFINAALGAASILGGLF